MGAEIYPFVEVDWHESEGPFGDAGGIRGFNLGEYFLWRSGGNLDMFYALGYATCPRCRPTAKGGWNGPPLFPLRGLPSHPGAGVLGRHFHVVDERGYREIHDPALPTITAREAEQYVAEWGSIDGPPLELGRGRGIERLRRVSCPTWHCTSWLGLGELEQALGHHGLRIDDLEADAQALIASMRTLEGRLGPGRTRLVYWFDNPPD